MTPYNKRDHVHCCFDQESPACGIKGKHRCCLCNEAVPPEQPKGECHCGKDGHALDSVNCPIHGYIIVPTPPQSDWREDFDYRFKAVTYGNIIADTATPQEIKSFISQVEQKSYEKGKREEREIVICAAVKCSDGTIIRGHRHGSAMWTVREMKKELISDSTQQGFITSRNRYVSREDGRKLQDAAGIASVDPEGYRGTTLFSEDLY